MALILLAIGGLLALVGVYALASGFPVIEIERGWSMVISGSVLLSGGLVVMALGIVVRSINGLKAGLPVVAAPARDHESATASPVSAPAAAGADELSSTIAAPAAAAAVAMPAAAMLDTGETSRSPLDVAPLASRPVTPIDDVADEPDADDSPAAHATAAHVAQPEPEPIDRAWHDQEFSAFDLDAPQETAASVHARETTPDTAENSAPHDRLATPAPAPRDAGSGAASPVDAQVVEPAPAEAPMPAATPEPVADAPATANPPSDLGVIGRYDSDGTSYVMYSDGSIEAQSETGVFRFGSMAELKAFIEG